MTTTPPETVGTLAPPGGVPTPVPRRLLAGLSASFTLALIAVVTGLGLLATVALRRGLQPVVLPLVALVVASTLSTLLKVDLALPRPPRVGWLHWPSDVVGGWLLGAAVATAVTAALARPRAGDGRTGRT